MPGNEALFRAISCARTKDMARRQDIWINPALVECLLREVVED